jgi:hypothetical protein
MFPKKLDTSARKNQHVAVHSIQLQIDLEGAAGGVERAVRDWTFG